MNKTALKVLSAVAVFLALAYVTYASAYLARLGLRRVTRLLETPPVPGHEQYADEPTGSAEEAGVRDSPEDRAVTDKKREEHTEVVQSPTKQHELRDETTTEMYPTKPVPEPTRAEAPPKPDPPKPTPAKQLEPPAPAPTSVADAGPTYEQMRTELGRAQRMR